MKPTLFLVLCSLAVALVGAGCGSGGGGGGGTCASTCEKSIALGCAEGEHDQDACEASCEGQQTSCEDAGQGSAFQTYLNCIQSSPMECGSTTDAPSSPDCLEEGLAVFACVLGGGDGSGSGGSGSDSGTGGSDSGSGGSDSGSGSTDLPDGAGFAATANGEEVSIPVDFTAVDLASGPDDVTTLSGNSGQGPVSFTIQFPGDEPGTFSCTADSNLPVVRFQLGEGAEVQMGDTYYDDGSCEIEVTSTTGPVVGTFTAHTEGGTGPLDITGSFAIPRPE